MLALPPAPTSQPETTAAPGAESTEASFSPSSSRRQTQSPRPEALTAPAVPPAATYKPVCRCAQEREVLCVSTGITDPRNPEIQQQNTPGVPGSRPKVTCVPAGCEPKRALGIQAHSLTVTFLPVRLAGAHLPRGWEMSWICTCQTRSLGPHLAHCLFLSIKLYWNADTATAYVLSGGSFALQRAEYLQLRQVVSRA